MPRVTDMCMCMCMCMYVALASACRDPTLAHVRNTAYYTGTSPGRARRLHSQIARHFRLPHLLLLSFESRNASLPFRRVRAENLSFDLVEASDFDRTFG